MKVRKFDYQTVLQGSYGCGWEDLIADDKSSAGRKRMREARADYRDNESGNYRIVSRRVKNEKT